MIAARLLAHPSDTGDTVEDDGEPNPDGAEREATDHHLAETGRFAPAREQGDGERREEVEKEGCQARVRGREAKDGRCEGPERERRDGHVRRTPEVTGIVDGRVVTFTGRDTLDSSDLTRRKERVVASI